MIPLSKPFLPDEAERAVNDCFKSSWLGYGPACNSLERRFITGHGGWALATTSCTAALNLAAHLTKTSDDDEIIVPALTFISTAMAFHAAGFKVRPVDVDPETLLISCDTIEAVISQKTRAVTVVHLYGQRAPVEGIRELCDKHNIIMIEDCAHRLTLLDNSPLLGDFACYSFNAVKEAPCGEGGLLWARNKKLETRAREISNLGLNIDTFQRASNLSHHDVSFGKETGLKSRLNDVLASIVNASLDNLRVTRERRTTLFKQYDSMINNLRPYVTPFRRMEDDSFLMYVVRLNGLDRERIRADMAKMGVATSIHYASLSEHPFFKTKKCPISMSNSRQLLTLPCFLEMSEDDQKMVIASMTKAVENQTKENVSGRFLCASY